ncbi:hypothetical protein [Phyllobacterium sp. SB3]|uniref:hypothetical protein n=1 Tax=Phyllobacterium sp. SB3 TaxID=3156073 RepID=UPI0032AF8434
MKEHEEVEVERTDTPKTGKEVLAEVVSTHTLEDTFAPDYDNVWTPKRLKFKSPGRPKKYHTDEELKAAKNASMAKYMKKRRNEDPEFREKQLQSQKNWYETKGREYMRAYMKRRYEQKKLEKQIQI